MNKLLMLAIIAQAANGGKTYLYKDGDECSALTGGWETGVSANTGAQSKEATYLSLTANATTSSTARRTYVTTNAIDLTNYTTLNFEFEQTAAEANKYGVYSTKSDKASSSNVVASFMNCSLVSCDIPAHSAPRSFLTCRRSRNYSDRRTAS